MTRNQKAFTSASGTDLSKFIPPQEGEVEIASVRLTGTELELYKELKAKGLSTTSLMKNAIRALSLLEHLNKTNRIDDPEIDKVVKSLLKVTTTQDPGQEPK